MVDLTTVNQLIAMINNLTTTFDCLSITYKIDGINPYVEIFDRNSSIQSVLTISKNVDLDNMTFKYVNSGDEQHYELDYIQEDTVE